MICIPAGQASVIYREIPKMALVGQNRALSMKKYMMMAASPHLHSVQLAILHTASVPDTRRVQLSEGSSARKWPDCFLSPHILLLCSFAFNPTGN